MILRSYMDDPEVSQAVLSSKLIEELSWADFVRLTCMFERWANEKRATPAQRMKCLDLADAMRAHIRALPYWWEPRPREGRPSLLKFVANLEEKNDMGAAPQ